jgi:hypothetical protein
VYVRTISIFLETRSSSAALRLETGQNGAAVTTA